jgi:hypothetical protein
MFTPSQIQLAETGTSSGWATSRVQGDLPQPLRFRCWLPVGQLLLCALLLLPFRNVIFMELFHIRVYSLAPDSGTKIGPDGSIQIHPNPAFERWLRAKDIACAVVAALNFPGGILQLATAIFSHDGREWTPARVEFRLWRALTWPFLALPFWWMAGRGIEALLASLRKTIAPHLRWWELCTGSIFFAGGATLCIGFLLFHEPSDLDSQLGLFIGSMAIWAILGGVMVLAKFLQWRIAKSSRVRG